MKGALAVLAAVVALVAPRAAQGQYFGRNNVRYEGFDFRVLKTEHFDVYYYGREDTAAVDAGRMAERWYARLSRLIDHQLRGRQPLILYANHTDYNQTAIAQVAGSEGVTEPFRRRVVLPMAGPMAETDHVIGHELVHAFQYDLSGIEPQTPLFGVPAMSGLPGWMVEGMAEYLSKGPRDPLTATWVRDALRSDKVKLPSVHDLANPYKYFPYRWGQALWAYIGGVWGDDSVEKVFKAAVQMGNPYQALQSVLGIPVDTLTDRWHAAIQRAYGPLLEETGQPADFGKTVIRGPGETMYNVGPSLSPDGKKIAFLSERSRYSIDIYLADAETGDIIRQITKTAIDPHYQSLEFTNSAGAWAPDGRRFALGAVSGGKPILSILDMDSGKEVRHIEFDDLGAIFNPTWSPDGDRIAFVANDGGLMDLFVVDVASGHRTRLTHDAFAELEPDWSPDGSRLVFVTDRFGADMGKLSPGPYRLAVMSADGGEIRSLPSFAGATNINPTWSPDGKSVYFVADPNGIPNVYRLDVGSGSFYRLTNVLAGVGGITALSPALSVAAKSGALAFSAFVDGAFGIYRIEPGTGLEGDPVPASAARAASGSVASSVLGRAYREAAPGEPSLSDLSLSWAPGAERTAPPAATLATSVFDAAMLPVADTDGTATDTTATDTTATDTTAAGRTRQQAREQEDAGMLPPERRGTSAIASLLRDPSLGLPQAATFSRHDYHAGLGLDYISQPTLGAGFGSFGSFIGGGAALHFSDMLNYHQLVTILQLQIVNGDVWDGIGAMGIYQNQSHRLIWGLQGGQLPQYQQYPVGRFGDFNGDGRLDLVTQTLRIWQTDRRALAMAQYPLSTVTRLEFLGGFEQIHYKVEAQTLAFDLGTGTKLFDQTQSAPPCADSLSFLFDLCEPADLNEGTGSAALVYDASITGPTGPIIGHRFRLEASPSFGTLNYVSALADFREYLMPIRPITLAGRILHYGRYGSGSSDDRLGRLFLGYPALVRGYDYGSFDLANCPSNLPSIDQCSEVKVYNSLFGSRMAVASGELRIPITGPLGLLTKEGQVPPLDLFGFVDAGVAWGAKLSRTASAQPFDIGQNAVTSTGFGGRINLFGFAVGEVYWVHPFDRPDKGNYVSFAIAPGF